MKEMFKYQVELTENAKDAFAGLDVEFEVVDLEAGTYNVYSPIPLGTELNTNPQVTSWDDLFEYCNDRFGILAIYTPEALYVTDDETDEVLDLTEAGQWLDDLLKEHTEELGISVENLGWEQDHYCVYFERDLDFVAEGEASFGWISNFVPALSISAMNEAARGSDFQFNFQWHTRH